MNLKPTTDLSLIASYRRHGKSAKWIMAKMGITRETYEAAVMALESAQDRLRATGYANLANDFTMLCHHYNLVGESLKSVAAGLEAVASEAEILKVLQTADLTPEQQAREIAQSFIVLRPFAPVVEIPKSNPS